MSTMQMISRIALLKKTLTVVSPKLQHCFSHSSRSSLVVVDSVRCRKPSLIVQQFASQRANFSSALPPRPPGANKNKGINFTWKSFFISGGIVSIFTAGMLYFKQEKMKQLESQRKKSLGQAALGGKFDLVDQHGRPFGSANLLGNWALIYFGFTHCPDVCPDELEKIVKAHEMIEKSGKADPIKMVFITVDPERDDVPAVREYIREFSPKFIGLTGNREQIEKATKAYRVYYSAGPRDHANDYIVDHTIITYLIDPEGNMVDYYGQTKTPEDVCSGVIKSMQKYKSMNSRLGFL